MTFYLKIIAKVLANFHNFSTKDITFWLGWWVVMGEGLGWVESSKRGFEEVYSYQQLKTLLRPTLIIFRLAIWICRYIIIKLLTWLLCSGRVSAGWKPQPVWICSSVLQIWPVGICIDWLIDLFVLLLKRGPVRIESSFFPFPLFIYHPSPPFLVVFF